MDWEKLGQSNKTGERFKTWTGIMCRRNPAQPNKKTTKDMHVYQ